MKFASDWERVTKERLWLRSVLVGQQASQRKLKYLVSRGLVRLEGIVFKVTDDGRGLLAGQPMGSRATAVDAADQFTG